MYAFIIAQIRAESNKLFNSDLDRARDKTLEIEPRVLTWADHDFGIIIFIL